jgi:hypothetical protein
MTNNMILILLLAVFLHTNAFGVVATNHNPGEVLIKRTTDFTISGEGSAENWNNTNWIDIPYRRGSGEHLSTKAKVLYSETGIYFLFNCKDEKLTATMNADFMDLWKEDVVEVFLWPDESSPTYFEYEISPLDYELPILISNEDGDLARWQPFHYGPDRKTRHATTVQGGEKKSNASITGWTAEFFIPYKLLRPLNNILPKPGTRWRANMYRIDYDDGTTYWSWQLTGKSFHDYKSFGTFVFE